jgi:hypothetical protein
MRITTQGMNALRMRIYRTTLLVALAFGAVSPVFRQDMLAKYVGFVSTIVLTVLAAYRVLRIPERD